MSLKENIIGLSCLYTTISIAVSLQFKTFLPFFIVVSSDLFHKTIAEVLVAVTDILQSFPFF